MTPLDRLAGNLVLLQLRTGNETGREIGMFNVASLPVIGVVFADHLREKEGQIK